MFQRLFWGGVALMAVLGAISGCAGGGDSSGGNAPAPTFDGIYKGSTAAKAKLSKAGDSLSLTFNGSTGMALWSRTTPKSFSYTARITLLHYNSGSKEISFHMDNFSAEYTSADFTGNAQFNGAGHLTDLNGTYTATFVNGTKENGTFTQTWHDLASKADFSGTWSGTLVGTYYVTGQAQTIQWTGNWTQDSSGKITGNLTSNLSDTTAQFTGQAVGDQFSGTYTGTYQGADLTGSFTGELETPTSMDGTFEIKSGILPLAGGTFTATRAQPTSNKPAVQFFNERVNGLEQLTAKVGQTVIGTQITPTTETNLVNVPPGTSNFTLANTATGTTLVNQNYTFDNTFREVFVALDDMKPGQIDVTAIPYQYSVTIPALKGNLTVVEGINTSSTGLGSTVDFYIVPENGGIAAGASPDASNVAYGEYFRKTFSIGRYQVIATSHGHPTDLLARSDTIVNTNGEYSITTLQSPPNKAARFTSGVFMFH